MHSVTFVSATSVFLRARLSSTSHRRFLKARPFRFFLQHTLFWFVAGVDCPQFAEFSPHFVDGTEFPLLSPSCVPDEDSRLAAAAEMPRESEDSWKVSAVPPTLTSASCPKTVSDSSVSERGRGPTYVLRKPSDRGTGVGTTSGT
jgi:hypothetical protein